MGISSLPDSVSQLGLNQLRLNSQSDHSDEDDTRSDRNQDDFLNIEISDGEDELVGDEFDGFDDWILWIVLNNCIIKVFEEKLCQIIDILTEKSSYSAHIQ